MKVLAADGFMLCRGLVRTLMLLHDDVFVTRADSIDEVLASIPRLPDLDLVVLDMHMPGMENFAGLRQTVEMVANAPVVVTSPIESRASILTAIHYGAKGYFSHSTKLCVLQHALPLIIAGECYIPASALRPGRGDLMLPLEGLSPRLRPRALSPRQAQIMGMLAEGKSNKEIARHLQVLEGTIKLHVKEILRKLGVKNRTEAVLAAARAGYLSKGDLGLAAPNSQSTRTDMHPMIVAASGSSPQHRNHGQ